MFPLPVGERVRVRGFLTRRSEDRFDNAIDIVEDVIVPKSQHEVAVCFEISGTLSIL
jgi:hypothetical protein